MPMIAMTREMGSLGKDVAGGLAARSGRKVVYHEIIEPSASKMRLRKSHVERFLEGRSGIWERLTTDKTALSIFTADETLRFLRDGTTGVIRGWGAVHLLKNVPHVIRLRIWREPEHYDLVLSTERLTIEECVDEVEAMLKKRPSRKAPSRCAWSTTLRWNGRCARPCAATRAPRR